MHAPAVRRMRLIGDARNNFQIHTSTHLEVWSNDKQVSIRCIPSSCSSKLNLQREALDRSYACVHLADISPHADVAKHGKRSCATTKVLRSPDQKRMTMWNPRQCADQTRQCVRRSITNSATGIAEELEELSDVRVRFSLHTLFEIHRSSIQPRIDFIKNSTLWTACTI